MIPRKDVLFVGPVFAATHLGDQIPPNPYFGGWLIGFFKPNAQNNEICILSKLLHPFQPNFAQYQASLTRQTVIQIYLRICRYYIVNKTTRFKTKAKTKTTKCEDSRPRPKNLVLRPRPRLNITGVLWSVGRCRGRRMTSICTIFHDTSLSQIFPPFDSLS